MPRAGRVPCAEKLLHERDEFSREGRENREKRREEEAAALVGTWVISFLLAGLRQRTMQLYLPKRTGPRGGHQLRGHEGPTKAGENVYNILGNCKLGGRRSTPNRS